MYLWCFKFSLEFIVSPTTVILFPWETSAVFECVVNPSIIVTSWEVNGTDYRLDMLFAGNLSGHNVSGRNITVSAPVNGTKYVCVIHVIPPKDPIKSDNVFLYIASKLLWICFIRTYVHTCTYFMMPIIV